MKCYRDKKLKVKVHVFEQGQRTCCCGDERVQKPEFTSWKRSVKKPKSAKQVEVEKEQDDALEDE